MHPLLSGGEAIPSPGEGRSIRNAIKHAAQALISDCKLMKSWRWAGADRTFFQGPVKCPGPFAGASASSQPQREPWRGHGHVCEGGIVGKVCSQTAFEHPGSVPSYFFFLF